MKYDVAMHLREQSKRTDLPADVIRTFSDAYAEIVRLEDRIKSLEEGFEGSCHVCEKVANKNDELRKRLEALDRLAQLDEELGLQ